MEKEEPRLVPLEVTVQDFADRQANKNMRAKTRQQRTVQLRNVKNITPAQLNELLSEFVLTVRTKDAGR